jgi:hypothetical protein
MSSIGPVEAGKPLGVTPEKVRADLDAIATAAGADPKAVEVGGKILEAFLAEHLGDPTVAVPSGVYAEALLGTSLAVIRELATAKYEPERVCYDDEGGYSSGGEAPKRQADSWNMHMGAGRRDAMTAWLSHPSPANGKRVSGKATFDWYKRGGSAFEARHGYYERKVHGHPDAIAMAERLDIRVEKYLRGSWDSKLSYEAQRVPHTQDEWRAWLREEGFLPRT